MKPLLTLLLIVLCLVPARFACAAEFAAMELPEFETEGRISPPLVDRMHGGISKRLDSYARSLDSFLGDKRADEEAADSELRIIGAADYHETNGLEFTQRVRARINLPRLKRKVNLLIDSDSDDSRTLSGQTTPVNLNATAQKDDTTVALQFVQKSTTDIGISHRVGVSISNEQLNPRARSQIRFTWYISDRDLLRFTQAVFWENVIGFGEESRFDFEHLLHRGDPATYSLFRATLRGVYSESSDGYEWTVPLEILNSLPNQRAYAYGVSISGVTDSDNGITDTRLFCRYRQSLWREWFFADITPQVNWPKANGRNTTTMINLSLEVVF